ncbi:aluminum-activated malate transporter 10 [Tanacetum coccineum]
MGRINGSWSLYQSKNALMNGEAFRDNVGVSFLVSKIRKLLSISFPDGLAPHESACDKRMLWIDSQNSERRVLCIDMRFPKTILKIKVRTRAEEVSTQEIKRLFRAVAHTNPEPRRGEIPPGCNVIIYSFDSKVPDILGQSMANGSGMAFNGQEWNVHVADGSSETTVVEPGVAKRLYIQLQGQIWRCLMKIGRFLEKARDIAASEPTKAIHGVKVGMALSLVSLFYYMKPLYDGVGGNAMWAVMTVVVAFEYSVGKQYCNPVIPYDLRSLNQIHLTNAGATIAKSFNRISATFLAGSLGIGVHWIANQCGELEPVILQASVAILGAAATFSRFIPSVKARFDYGAMIFILTFCFVSVSGYRVEKVIELARNRVSTIAIGTSICIFTSTLFYPVWAGKELHKLIYKNLEKLADSLNGCVTEYFKDNEERSGRKQEGYKSVLNSKASEEAMANLARWEPAHGRFKFRHPWKQYLRVGASMRSCAYCIETLNGFISSEVQAPELLKKHLKEVCMTLTSSCSNVLKELAMTMKTMTKSTKTKSLVQEMNFAVQSFQNVLKDLSKQALVLPEHELDEGKLKTQIVPIMAIVPLATLASLLIEIAERVEGIVGVVDEVAAQAEFEVVKYKKNKENKPLKLNQDHVITTPLQRV